MRAMDFSNRPTATASSPPSWDFGMSWCASTKWTSWTIAKSASTTSFKPTRTSPRVWTSPTSNSSPSAPCTGTTWWTGRRTPLGTGAEHCSIIWKRCMLARTATSKTAASLSSTSSVLKRTPIGTSADMQAALLQGSSSPATRWWPCPAARSPRSTKSSSATKPSTRPSPR